MSLLFSDAFGDEVIDHYCGGSALSAPANWELSLWTGNPFDGGTELSGSGYARYTKATATPLMITGPGTWGYAMVSQTAWTFPETGNSSADWVPYSYIGMGRTVAAAPEIALQTSSPITVTNGNNSSFPAGSIQIDFGSAAQPPLIQEVWAEALLNAMFAGGSAPGVVGTWYLGLWLGNPYNGGVEVSTVGTSYARLALTNNAGNWAAATVTDARARAVATALRWPASGVAAGAFGQVLYVGFCPGASSAPSFVRPLPGTGRTVGAGGFLSIPAGGLIVPFRTQGG